MDKNTILSGIRASGKLHLGNYLGALKHFVKVQALPNNNCFFFIADLHALTTDFEPKQLRHNTLEVAAEYLAAGIDPEKSTFFVQSAVLEHALLGWIFNSGTPLGELERMTQYKDKSKQNQKNINSGLLTYPTLMAADILLYKPDFVPVGEDQTQHLEFTRIIVRKFNRKFGKTFPEPKNLFSHPLRIMSLTDPSKKMSKTHDEALMLDDAPQEIMRKLKKAVTASESGKKSAGVENLFLLLEHFGSLEEVKYFRQQQRNDSLKFSELKETLARQIADYFEEFREKKQQLLAKPNYIAEILGQGAHKARQVASQTLMEVKQRIGLL